MSNCELGRGKHIKDAQDLLELEQDTLFIVTECDCGGLCIVKFEEKRCQHCGVKSTVKSWVNYCPNCGEELR